MTFTKPDNLTKCKYCLMSLDIMFPYVGERIYYKFINRHKMNIFCCHESCYKKYITNEEFKLHVPMNGCVICNIILTRNDAIEIQKLQYKKGSANNSEVYLGYNFYCIDCWESVAPVDIFEFKFSPETFS